MKSQNGMCFGIPEPNVMNLLTLLLPSLASPRRVPYVGDFEDVPQNFLLSCQDLADTVFQDSQDI